LGNDVHGVRVFLGSLGPLWYHTPVVFPSMSRLRQAKKSKEAATTGQAHHLAREVQAFRCYLLQHALASYVCLCSAGCSETLVPPSAANKPWPHVLLPSAVEPDWPRCCVLCSVCSATEPDQPRPCVPPSTANSKSHVSFSIPLAMLVH